MRTIAAESNTSSSITNVSIRSESSIFNSEPGNSNPVTFSATCNPTITITVDLCNRDNYALLHDQINARETTRDFSLAEMPPVETIFKQLQEISEIECKVSEIECKNDLKISHWLSQIHETTDLSTWQSQNINSDSSTRVKHTDTRSDQAEASCAEFAPGDVNSVAEAVSNQCTLHRSLPNQVILPKSPFSIKQHNPTRRRLERLQRLRAETLASMQRKSVQISTDSMDSMVSRGSEPAVTKAAESICVPSSVRTNRKKRATANLPVSSGTCGPDSSPVDVVAASSIPETSAAAVVLASKHDSQGGAGGDASRSSSFSARRASSEANGPECDNIRGDPGHGGGPGSGEARHDDQYGTEETTLEAAGATARGSDLQIHDSAAMVEILRRSIAAGTTGPEPPVKFSAHPTPPPVIKGGGGCVSGISGAGGGDDGVGGGGGGGAAGLPQSSLTRSGSEGFGVLRPVPDGATALTEGCGGRLLSSGSVGLGRRSSSSGFGGLHLGRTSTWIEKFPRGRARAWGLDSGSVHELGPQDPPNGPAPVERRRMDSRARAVTKLAAAPAEGPVAGGGSGALPGAARTRGCGLGLLLFALLPRRAATVLTARRPPV